MNVNHNIRERILNQPSYWIENINGYLYDALVSYMNENNMKQADLAKHLKISTGRISQILNDGEINYSLDKIIKIALQVDKFPNFKFENKSEYFQNEKMEFDKLSLVYKINQFAKVEEPQKKKRSKTISIGAYSESNYQVALP